MKSTKEMPGQFTLFDLCFSIPVENRNTVTTASLVGASTVKKAKQKKEQLSPVQKFIKEYNGYRIEDCCTVTGDDFKSYCRKLKSALNKEAKLMGFDSVTLHPGHYDMYGFFKKDDKYVYWSFSVVRDDMPTFLDKSDYFHGFLYRTAKSDKDFTGGNNHYTDLANLVSEAYSLI